MCHLQGAWITAKPVLSLLIHVIDAPCSTKLALAGKLNLTLLSKYGHFWLQKLMVVATWGVNRDNRVQFPKFWRNLEMFLLQWAGISSPDFFLWSHLQNSSNALKHWVVSVTFQRMASEKTEFQGMKGSYRDRSIKGMRKVNWRIIIF